LSSIVDRFRARFGSEPQVYRAPGRVNLIGEHTDYNDGFVMPAAIGFYCWVAIGPRTDRKLQIVSEDFSETAELNLAGPPPAPVRSWSDYPTGVALELQKAGVQLRGANLLIHGQVPMGAGLSSSASIEAATALALSEQAGTSMDRSKLALLCQKAENEYVGARVGIMDQFISLNGRHDQALVLDCRSLDFSLVAIPEHVKLVICNTMVKHEVATSGYNERRAESERAVQLLSRALPGIRALRDVTPEQLERHRDLLPELIYKRALHVILENARVLDSADALRAGDVRRFGQRMAESHLSLRDLYQVSSPELDLMVDLANRQPGVYGARMTGGGFGGATINLVEADSVGAFKENVSLAYQAKAGIATQIYICAPAEGAALVTTAELASGAELLQ
jgi:galactokinase